MPPTLDAAWTPVRAWPSTEANGAHPQPIAFETIIPATRHEKVSELIDSLVLEGLGPTIRVVDDTPTGRVGRAVARRRVRVLPTRGIGPGRARDAGAAKASSRWLLFLDDDVVVPPGFGEHMKSVIASLDDGVGIVEFPVLPIGRARPPYWRCRLVESRWPGAFLTACLLVRRDVFATLSDAGSSLPGPFREDTDLGASVLRLGLRSHWCGSFPVHHPIERVSLRRFLATAALFRCDAIFNRRQPGYLARTGEQLRLGPLTVRHLRRRIGIVTAAGMTAGVVARCPRVAAAVPLAAGFALNAVHLRALRRAGEPIRLRALFSPRDISAHAVWAVVAGMARAAGEASVLVQRGSGKGCESV